MGVVLTRFPFIYILSSSLLRIGSTNKLKLNIQNWPFQDPLNLLTADVDISHSQPVLDTTSGSSTNTINTVLKTDVAEIRYPYYCYHIQLLITIMDTVYSDLNRSSVSYI